MDLRHLRYFVAVAEELHFGRAARRLNISQPPLSQQIKELEQELAVHLLNRTRRSVELTFAGRVFLDRARRVLRDASELKEATRRAERGEVGELSIGFVHSVGYSLLPPVVRHFREANLGVSLSLREQTATEQAEELARSRIDVGFTRPGAMANEVTSELLLREPFVLALPRAHPTAHEARPRLEHLKDEDFITYPRHRAPGFYESIIRLCASASFVPKISQETNTIHTALGLVGAGIGIAIVPASAMEIQTREVVFRLPVETEPQAEIVMAWRRDSASPALQRFIEAARLTALRYGEAQQAVLAQMRGPEHSRA